jgi:hypothetical protein
MHRRVAEEAEVRDNLGSDSCDTWVVVHAVLEEALEDVSLCSGAERTKGRNLADWWRAQGRTSATSNAQQ